MINEGQLVSEWSKTAGKAPTEITTAASTPVGKLLEVFGLAFVDEVGELYSERVKSSSGALLKSIQFPVKQSGASFELEVSSDEYGDYIDQGVSGTESGYNTPFSFKTNYPNMKMATSIREWIPSAGISIPEGFTPESFSYAIATNKKKFGIKPTGIFEDALSTQNINALESALAEVIGITVTVAVDNKFKAIEKAQK